MSACSIIQCGARKNPDQPLLTLHRFPKNEVLRQKWLEVIGVENVKTGVKIPRVCSTHFAESSFNRTLDVTRLRDDAVPSIHLVPSNKTHTPVLGKIKNVKEQTSSMKTQPPLPMKNLDRIHKEPGASAPSTCASPDLSSRGSSPRSASASPDLSMEDDNLVEIKVCRVCLAMDVKMFDMKDTKLTDMFRNVTGISVRDKKGTTPQRVCWECAARLTAAATFKNKALLSDGLLKNITHMNKNDIAKLKHIYRDSLDSPLTFEPAFTDDISPDDIETDDETDCEDEPPIVKPLKTKRSDPVVENNSNIQTKHMNSEIFSALTIENSVSCNNNDKVLSEDAVMTHAPINEDCYIVIVTGDEENIPKIDVVGNTENETLSEEDTESLEVSANKAKKVTIRKVGASSEQGNRLNNGERQKIIAINENGLSLANGVNAPGFDDDGIADTDVIEDPSDEEYVLSDKENCSSDDSLPSEKCKEKTVARTVKKREDPTDPKISRRYKPLTIEGLNFTYTELTLEEQLAEIVKRQEGLNYKNGVFHCTVCYKGFLDLGAYNSHMLKHTNRFGEHECPVCKKRYSTKLALGKHRLAHKQKYSCNACTFVTRSRGIAARHEQWHKGHKYTCPHCQAEFHQFTTYMGHIRIKHPSDFVCGLCGYSFVSAKGIEVHQKLKHKLDNVQIPEDGPLCELCNVKFVSSEALQRHRRVSAKHNPDKKSREPNKPKQDLTRRVLENGRWRRIHPAHTVSKAEPMPCEQCGVELKDSRAYFAHFRRMHPDKNRTKYAMKTPCMCEVCGKMIQSYHHFKDHVCLHVRELRFTCETCGKAFRTKTSLVNHQVLHSQVRPTFECSVCGKKFSSCNNRHRHMVIHTGLKAYKCEICGKAFRLAALKQAHVNYVHLKKPWPKRTRRKRKSETGQI